MANTAIDQAIGQAAGVTRAFPHMTPEKIEAFGRELDAIRERVIADLGERDAKYIRNLMKFQRRCEVGGRALLFAGLLPPAWLAGTALLSVSKVLENMEIGHNVMHGQYDFMKDPSINGNRYDWDTVCPGDTWRHSHNYMHHTFTNIVGKDRDVGYGILRMAEEQPWEPKYLGNPAYALALALLFQWGVGLHDIETEKVLSGEKSREQALEELKFFWKKARRQVTKDYLLFPALAGPFFLPVLLGNATANLVRNVWAFSVIFCGHFPDGTVMFTEEECRNETRGQWYLRQLLGSANIEGGKLMHIATGNLSHQIEHHLFPDLPGHRYAEIAVEVRAICAKYDLPYNTGKMTGQLASVARRIARLALP
ncbi:MAG: fatty acid desaturase family protein [Gammaproteobacteria bacterium]